ncbi:methyltransferase family protein [Candidatus Stoquefichus massiliensis]|uniref:methyltransferase family protein n=1 Tax=Candidatus Stoquefichus massiliensis TaxID=1470350 RepID=UPI000483C777|nr:isoprenylcysteine carboxylmethyltransferase family protein [Candidatus Stoquefichus massiliensis]
MGAFLLLILFFLIRFTLLSYLNKDAVKRAAYFAPLIHNEKIAYYIYQISNMMIFIFLCFFNVKIDMSWQFYLGLFLYSLGLFLLTLSVIDFASASDGKINTNGIYRFSRHPMYLSYFVYFMGCVFLTQSIFLLVIVLIFQISAHWIILSEERWCLQQFGEQYKDYMSEVRRYL